MFENPWRGRQARNFTTNVLKILDLKSSHSQFPCRSVPIYIINCRWVVVKWSNDSHSQINCFRTVSLINVPPTDVYRYRMRYVQVCTQCKNCNISKKFENSLNQWKAVKGEVRKTPTKNAIFVKPAKFAKNWKICKIRKFA